MNKAFKVGATIGSAWLLLTPSCAQPDEAPAGATHEAQSPGATVVLERLQAQVFVKQQSFSGEVWALSDASLTVGEAGRVKVVHVAEGDRVVQGQLLVELENELALAQLGQARATEKRITVQHGQATLEAARFERLLAQEVVSDRASGRELSQAQALDAAKTGAQATVHLMSQRVQQHRILAPFAGTVAQRSVDPGDWLKPGEAAIQLFTDSQVEILVRIPPWLLDQAVAGSEVQLVDGARHTKAVVTSSVPALDRQTRTALVRLAPTEPCTWLRPGADVQVVFSVVQKGGLTVPRDALVYGVGGVKVMRVNNSVAEAVDVSVLATSGAKSLVASTQLQLGDNLVVRGNERLRSGQRVQIQGALSGYGATVSPKISGNSKQ